MSIPRDNGPVRATALAAVLRDADAAALTGTSYAGRVWATGFSPLDSILGGGLRAGDLTLLGGEQGLGKTTFALQMARNVAAGGGDATYVCFEHDEYDLLARLLGMEAGLQRGVDAVDLAALRKSLAGWGQAAEADGLRGRLRGHDGGTAAVEGVERYADRLHLVCVNGERFDLDRLVSFVQAAPSGPVFVDYLQKLRLARPDVTEDERVTAAVETLKDVAMSTHRPVVSVVAADREGIASGRTRLEHLRGSSALVYEADVAIMLNSKYRAVAREHLSYNTTNADRFKEHLIVSVEKNRAGSSDVHLDFRTDMSRGYIDTHGEPLLERLRDDRLAVG